MRFFLKHKMKSILVLFSFTFAYVASVVLATALAEETLENFFKIALLPMIIGSALTIVLILIFGLHSVSYRRVSLSELFVFSFLAFAVSASNFIISIFVDELSIAWCFINLFVFLLLDLVLACNMRVYELLLSTQRHMSVSNRRKVLIIGAGDAGNSILKEINSSDKIDYYPIGFIDDNEGLHGSHIAGLEVLGGSSDVKKIAAETGAEVIIVAIPTATAQQIKRITEHCLDTGCEIKVLPGVYQLINGKVSVTKLRDVDVQDLLGRDPIDVNLEEVMGYIENKTVMVTGGGGSIGSELSRQIAGKQPRRLLILDIYENNAYEIEQELSRKYPELEVVTLIASVRDYNKMRQVFRDYRPDIVFHAAAHKHVPLMETSPNEAVKNNIIGTYNVVKCADEFNTSRFVQISTDKAVNPTNIMGATKRVCEMIIQAYATKSNTKFVAVRFGNVLGSNGSVIPLFKKQIMDGGPVRVTHKDIIRYFMTIPEAVSLVLQAGAYAKGGEIYVLDMGEQVRIYDLAENLIKLMGYEPHVDIEIEITGLRPGEKLYEERLMAEEGLRTTPNGLISIAKPIPMDNDELWTKLEELRIKAYDECDDIKHIVAELVHTYVIDGENK